MIMSHMHFVRICWLPSMVEAKSHSYRVQYSNPTGHCFMSAALHQKENMMSFPCKSAGSILCFWKLWALY